jgi:hypothetical protein
MSSRRRATAVNFVLKTPERALISLATGELTELINALNAVCDASPVPDAAFQSRPGVDRSALCDLLRHLSADAPSERTRYECVDVWAETASVMVRAVSVFGDPVELSTEEARVLVERLEQSIATAS